VRACSGAHQCGWTTDVEKEAACFRSGGGIAYRGAVVWTQLYSKVPTEMLGVRSDAAPTSDWPGLFIGRATDFAVARLLDEATVGCALLRTGSCS